MSKRYIITSSGTDIGKTFVSTVLIEQLRQAHKTVAAYKPVISGFDAACPEGSDIALLLQAQRMDINADSIAAISCYRLKAPLSPHMAAARENKYVDMDTLVDWCSGRDSVAEYQLFEGAGGVSVPLNNTQTSLDWMKQLGYPLIMVVGSYLGSISHTLTAVKTAQSEGCTIGALIVSESQDSGVSADETVTTLRQFTHNIPHITLLPRVNSWQQAPDLLDVLA